MDIQRLPKGVHIRDMRTGMVYELGEWIDNEKRVIKNDHYLMDGTIDEKELKFFTVID